MSYYDSTGGQAPASAQVREYPSGGSTFTAQPNSGRVAGFRSTWLFSGNARGPFSSGNREAAQADRSAPNQSYASNEAGGMQTTAPASSRSWSGPVDRSSSARAPARGYGSYGGGYVAPGAYGPDHLSPYGSSSSLAIAGVPLSEMHLMVDEATRPDLPLEGPHPQFDPILGRILTMVRGGEIAARAIKDRLKSKNERTLLLTLALLQRAMEECPNFYMHVANARFFRRMWRLVVPDYKNSMRERFYATFDKDALQRKYATGEIDKPIYYPSVAMKVMQLIEAWGEEFERFRPYDSKGQFFVKRWRKKTRKYSFPPMPALEVPAVYRPGTSERSIELRRQHESGQSRSTTDTATSPSVAKARASNTAAARSSNRPRYELRDISEAADLAAALMDSAPDAGTVANDEDIAALITTCKAMLREMENMVASMDSEKSVVEAIAVNEKLLLVINRYEDICLMDPKTILNRDAAREISPKTKATTANAVTRPAGAGGKRTVQDASDDEDDDDDAESSSVSDDEREKGHQAAPINSNRSAGSTRDDDMAAAGAVSKTTQSNKEDTLLWLDSDDEDGDNLVDGAHKRSDQAARSKGQRSRKTQPALQPQQARGETGNHSPAGAAQAVGQSPAYYVESPPSTQYGSYASVGSAGGPAGAQASYGAPMGYPYMHPNYYGQVYPYAAGGWYPYGYPYGAGYGYGMAPGQPNAVSGPGGSSASSPMYGAAYGGYPAGSAYAASSTGAFNAGGAGAATAAANPFDTVSNDQNAYNSHANWPHEQSAPAVSTTRHQAVGHTSLLSITAGDAAASTSAAPMETAGKPASTLPALAPAMPMASSGAMVPPQAASSKRSAPLFDVLWEERVPGTAQGTQGTGAGQHQASSAYQPQGGESSTNAEDSGKNPFG
ncbi:hypothetical protein F1559_003919 [Cyanidiococcus yangmingshanensis]|uniref:VHS domain-containing protein n=1 Tax=Cyanidiococcus yangmingshanensis TaxID=2690220 RepID=A0A7J7IGG9_9RHOD|nr:hypothetical protein F1559_003919 [Cyanidiococcus yangmingshanensis]